MISDDRVLCNPDYLTWKDSRGFSCQDYVTNDICKKTIPKFSIASVFNRPADKAMDYLIINI